MTDFKKSNPAGRSIALTFSYVGWVIAAIGILLAVTGFLLGATPGVGGASAPVTMIGRIASAGLGLAVLLFGLFSVLMAAQTRAALDTADMTREMLRFARLGARVATEAAHAPVAPSAAEGTHDPVPPIPAGLRARVLAQPPVPVAKADLRAVPTPDRAPASAPSSGRPSPDASPRIVAPVKPSASVKPHPIFSAKPPR